MSFRRDASKRRIHHEKAFPADIGAFGLITVAMAALLVRMLRQKSGRGKALNVLTCLFLAAGIANILYWQLYQFWALL